MSPSESLSGWLSGIASLHTAVDLLGRRPDPERMGFSGQPAPWQHKGFGTNVARYFENRPFDGSLGEPLPHDEMRAINDYLVEVFACMASEAGIENEGDFSIIGMLLLF